MTYLFVERVTEEDVKDKYNLYDAIKIARYVSTKLCVIRNIPAEELEYCVANFDLVHNKVPSTPKKYEIIIQDLMHFFGIHDSDFFRDANNCMVDEEKMWVDKLIEMTKCEDIIWKYKDGYFYTQEYISIYPNKKTRTLLYSDHIEHLCWSNAQSCPNIIILNGNIKLLHEMAIRQDKEYNQFSHLHRYLYID